MQSVLVSFFWQSESKVSPGPRCTALSVRSLFLGTSNCSAQRVLTFLLAALVRVQHLLSAYSIPGTLCGIQSKSDKSHSSGLMSNPKAANERLLGSILPLAFCLIPTVLNIFLFIINCQLLASLKWVTSAGFLNIKSQPPLPLTQDKGPLEMTSVPTFPIVFHPDNCGPIHPWSQQISKQNNFR